MPGVSINRITFSDGNQFTFDSQDIVVLVGPNNCGKTQALHNIFSKMHQAQTAGKVITNIEVATQGTADDAFLFIKNNSIEKAENGTVHYKWMNAQAQEVDIKTFWNASPQQGLISLTSFFGQLFRTDDRLSLARSQPPIDLNEPPTHPLHYVWSSETISTQLSVNFKNAFGFDLVTRRFPCKNLILHVGNDPRIGNEDRTTDSYIARLDQLPPLDSQGDGMRAFAGLMIHSIVPHYSFMLIDEPEAFLHPPQARYLGKSLVTDIAHQKQLFISTHSSDILKGILETNNDRVHVIRLQRDETNPDINKAKLLPKANLAQIWSAPILRYSNVLDGLFHEKVIVCESDADCTFYSAVLDWIYETDHPTIRKLDVMFIHAGGISGIKKIVEALIPLSVPVSVVVDFDGMNKAELRQISEAMGMTWLNIQTDYQAVRANINAIPPSPPEVVVVRADITTILDAEPDPHLSPLASTRITNAAKNESGWAKAKVQGKSVLTTAVATVAFDNVVNQLNAKNVFIVPIGEMENFCPAAASSHAGKWLTKVFDDPALKIQAFTAAKPFVKKLFNLP